MKFQLSFKALYYTFHVCLTSSTLRMSYHVDPRQYNFATLVVQLHMIVIIDYCFKTEKVVNMSQSIKWNSPQQASPSQFGWFYAHHIELYSCELVSLLIFRFLGSHYHKCSGFEVKSSNCRKHFFLF